ncbi:hypothetical protein [Pseudomonas citronellolis]|uniref:hypothetical protein n=1 Tax=Pseudomonas citronellolis TaxID=53408 RepID=UPI0018D8C08F|nr:hypothetical protein [Pseudomonas citronellolis]MBH3436005.1 hypothetical protein [Pseudomonas citronellolis]
MPRNGTQGHTARHEKQRAHVQAHYGKLGLSPEEVDALARLARRSKPATEKLLGMTRKELLARATRAGVRGRWRMTKAALVAARS